MAWIALQDSMPDLTQGCLVLGSAVRSVGRVPHPRADWSVDLLGRGEDLVLPYPARTPRSVLREPPHPTWEPSHFTSPTEGRVEESSIAKLHPMRHDRVACNLPDGQMLGTD
jgi:hypothetical protein